MGKGRSLSCIQNNLDENVAEIFVKILQDEIDRVWSSEVKEMILMEEDKTNFEKAAECWICKKSFTDGEGKVQDHCHFSDKFRGAPHNKCNLLFRKPKHLPVIFHNLAGYDSNLSSRVSGKHKVILIAFQTMKRTEVYGV